MMTDLQLASVVQAIVVALLSLVLIKLYSVFRLDSFRQQMFALRDELFDYAAQGYISFDDPAYLLLREQMNTMIRYGHQLTFFRLVMGKLVPKIARASQKELWGGEWDRTLSAVRDQEVRERLANFHNRERLLEMRRVVGGSPVLVAVFIAAVGFYILKNGLKPFTQIEDATKRKVMRGPIDFKYIEEDASLCAAR